LGQTDQETQSILDIPEFHLVSEPGPIDIWIGCQNPRESLGQANFRVIVHQRSKYQDGGIDPFGAQVRESGVAKP
jgi:hypothetical protein